MKPRRRNGRHLFSHFQHYASFYLENVRFIKKIEQFVIVIEQGQIMIDHIPLSWRLNWHGFAYYYCLYFSFLVSVKLPEPLRDKERNSVQ